MRRRSLVLDSNLLLLLLVGSIDPAWIARMNRLSAFTPEHFERLAAIVERFGGVVTTPHVLTEVSNLANVMRWEWKEAFTAIFRRWIDALDERHASAKELARDPLFRFGIADTSLMHSADFALILTEDGRFASQLKSDTKALAINLETAIALGDDLDRA